MVVLLLISFQGIVIDAGEPLMEGITVVTLTGWKSTDLFVVTLATNASAGEMVTFEASGEIVVESEDGVTVTPMSPPVEESG